MTRAIGAIACLSLLILQLSGAHVHIGAEGYVGAPETSYSHDHGHDRGHHKHGHPLPDAAADHDTGMPAGAAGDYQDAQDVSLLDQTLTSVKIPLALLTLIVLFVVLPRARRLVGIDVAYRLLSGRHTRWRPPLRAPPQPA